MEWKGISMSVLALLIIALVVSIVVLQSIPELFPVDSPHYLLLTGSYLGLIALAMFCYFRTMFSDPGQTERCLITDEKLLRKRMERLKEQGLSVCEVCKAYKPARVHHCSQCARCIYKMDHHCPWVNNCIGAGNQKYFVLFLMYITIASLYSLLLSLLALMEMQQSIAMAPTALSLAASVGFGAFTLQLLLEQSYYIIANTSLIDILQGREASSVSSTQRPLLQNVQAALGRNPALWCCPTAVPQATTELEDPLLGEKLCEQQRMSVFP